jgi:hypothetical protein
MTWSVKFAVSCSDGDDDILNERCAKLKTALESERYTKGVGNQFIAQGCDKILGCCPKTIVDIPMWAEDHNYAGYFPELSTLPSACFHTMEDEEESQKVCDMCKSAVTVTLEELPYCDDIDEQPLPESQEEFSNSNILMENQIPKHKPFQKRCMAIKEMVSSQFGSMQSTFQAKVCDCLGCCSDKPQLKGQCYYPVSLAR